MGRPQARNLAIHGHLENARFLLRDRDAKYSGPFDEVFLTEGLRIVKTPVRAPRANAFAERWVRTARRECLDHIISLGRRHLFHIDQQARTVSCPAAATATITASGQASFACWCQRCPLRGRCTTAKGGRTIRIHPHEDELRAARRRATTRSFQQATGAGGR